MWQTLQRVWQTRIEDAADTHRGCGRHRWGMWQTHSEGYGRHRYRVTADTHGRYGRHGRGTWQTQAEGMTDTRSDPARGWIGVVTRIAPQLNRGLRPLTRKAGYKIGEGLHGRRSGCDISTESAATAMRQLQLEWAALAKSSAAARSGLSVVLAGPLWMLLGVGHCLSLCCLEEPLVLALKTLIHQQYSARQAGRGTALRAGMC